MAVRKTTPNTATTPNTQSAEPIGPAAAVKTGGLP